VRKYSFKPRRDEFVRHLIDAHRASNNTFCAKISGHAAPGGEKMAETDSTDKLVAARRIRLSILRGVLEKVDDPTKLGSNSCCSATRPISRGGEMVALGRIWTDPMRRRPISCGFD